MQSLLAKEQFFSCYLLFLIILIYIDFFKYAFYEPCILFHIGGSQHFIVKYGGQVKAPIKTGRRQKVKVLYCEDLANHASPESCGGGGNIMAEALTGESVGMFHGH
jgi:hypothetical protein